MDCHCAVASDAINATNEDQFGVAGQARKSRFIGETTKNNNQADEVASMTEASFA